MDRVSRCYNSRMGRPITTIGSGNDEVGVSSDVLGVAWQKLERHRYMTSNTTYIETDDKAGIVDMYHPTTPDKPYINGQARYASHLVLLQHECERISGRLIEHYIAGTLHITDKNVLGSFLRTLDIGTSIYTYEFEAPDEIGMPCTSKLNEESTRHVRMGVVDYLSLVDTSEDGARQNADRLARRLEARWDV